MPAVSVSASNVVRDVYRTSSARLKRSCKNGDRGLSYGCLGVTSESGTSFLATDDLDT